MPDKTDAELEAERGVAATAEAKAKADLERQGNEEVVPKKQFLAAIKSANEKYAALEAKLDAAIAAGSKKADLPKQYTRAELKAAVEGGQITQDAADQVWDDQIQARADARAAAVSTEIVTRAKLKERVDSDIGRYVALEPDVLIPGSEIRDKVAKEFNYFVSLGDPKTPETELKAMRAALGPIDQLELARSGITQHDTHRETGGGGPGGKPKGDKENPLVAKLTTRQREYYEGQIKAGQYKNWKDVEATLKFADPATRPSLGA